MSKSNSVMRFSHLLPKYLQSFYPLLRFWRFSVVIIVVYIEDVVGISNYYETTLMQSKFVRETLLKVGFVPNIDKSN